jgi:predicted KAP-like P-loop ATPase
MKINLRQAHAIQTQIRDEINRLNLATGVTLNEFENPKDQIDTARFDFEGSLKTHEKLTGVLLDIRKKVARANADEGISDLLADAALLDTQIKLYQQFADAKPQQPTEVLEGRLEKRRNAQEDPVYRGFGSNDIHTGIFTQQEIDSHRRELANYKRTKQGVQEMILAANIDTQIELDADEEKLLARMGIISDFGD